MRIWLDVWSGSDGVYGEDLVESDVGALVGSDVGALVGSVVGELVGSDVVALVGSDVDIWIELLMGILVDLWWDFLWIYGGLSRQWQC